MISSDLPYSKSFTIDHYSLICHVFILHIMQMCVTRSVFYVGDAHSEKMQVFKYTHFIVLLHNIFCNDLYTSDEDAI